MPAIHAAGTGSVPDAIGRFFLSGCCRSASTSARSLKIYTLDEIRQNNAKPAHVRRKESTTSNCLSNTSAAKMKMFFVTHCRGRMVFKRAFSIGLFYLIQYFHAENSTGCFADGARTCRVTRTSTCPGHGGTGASERSSRAQACHCDRSKIHAD